MSARLPAPAATRRAVSRPPLLPPSIQIAVVGGELALPTRTASGRVRSSSPGTASTLYDEELRTAAGLIRSEANIHFRANMNIMEAAYENREAGWKNVCKEFEQVYARHRARHSD